MLLVFVQYFPSVAEKSPVASQILIPSRNTDFKIRLRMFALNSTKFQILDLWKSAISKVERLTNFRFLYFYYTDAVLFVIQKSHVSILTTIYRRRFHRYSFKMSMNTSEKCALRWSRYQERLPWNTRKLCDEDDTTVDHALFFLILSPWRSGINDLTGGSRTRLTTAFFATWLVRAEAT